MFENLSEARPDAPDEIGFMRLARNEVMTLTSLLD